MNLTTSSPEALFTRVTDAYPFHPDLRELAEAELADSGPVVFMAGIDEPLGVADVFAIKADADSDAELIEAAKAAGFTVVDA